MSNWAHCWHNDVYSKTESQQELHRNISPPSSRSKNKRGRTRAWTYSASHQISRCFLLDVLYDPEDGGDIFVRNVDFQQTIQHYIPEDCTFQLCVNLNCSDLNLKLIERGVGAYRPLPPKERQKELVLLYSTHSTLDINTLAYITAFC
jgi:hypothetical protein